MLPSGILMTLLSVVYCQVYLEDQTLGCDGVIGSRVKLDRCGVCGGDQTTCKIISGIFTKIITGAKYELVTKIPKHAHTVNITEGRDTRNYLALRYSESKVGILNINWTLDWGGSYNAAGAIIEYNKPKHTGEGEHIFIAGPLTADIELLLLSQTRNPGIYYTYSLPLQPQYPSRGSDQGYLQAPETSNLRYGAKKSINTYQSDFAAGLSIYGVESVAGGSSFEWQVLDLNRCTETCGEGFREIDIVCIQVSSQAKVREDSCDSTLKPKIRKTSCNTQPCKPRWATGEWSSCSQTCGKGFLTRSVECRRRISSLRDVSVYAIQCRETKPSTIQMCLLKDCYKWVTTPWSACSTRCGPGRKNRQVHCTDSSGTTVDDILCTFDKPRHVEKCYATCERSWYMSEWEDQCANGCGMRNQTRLVYCPTDEDKHGDKDSMCGQKPDTGRPCDTTRTCRNTATWFTGEWSQCSGDCDSAYQKRQVICMIKRGAWLVKSPDTDCHSGTKPADTTKCHLNTCSNSKSVWISTYWTKCSTTCGDGYQKREIKCVNFTLNETTDCDEDLKPDTIKPCFYTECPSNDSIQAAVSADCGDEYGSCTIVVQARLCRIAYYKSLCCKSCS